MAAEAKALDKDPKQPTSISSGTKLVNKDTDVKLVDKFPRDPPSISFHAKLTNDNADECKIAANDSKIQAGSWNGFSDVLDADSDIPKSDDENSGDPPVGVISLPSIEEEPNQGSSEEPWSHVDSAEYRHRSA